MYEISLTFVQQYYINIKLLEYSTLIEHIKYETLKKKEANFGYRAQCIWCYYKASYVC